jgi:hypothetical protein
MRVPGLGCQKFGSWSRTALAYALSAFCALAAEVVVVAVISLSIAGSE